VAKISSLAPKDLLGGSSVRPSYTKL